MTPSKFQLEIYDFIQYGNGHGIINAVAGSGKTTTIINALHYIDGKCIFLAFNKTIATELKKRVPDNIETSTIHAIGLQHLRTISNNILIESNKIEMIMDNYIPLKLLNSMKWDDKQKIINIRKHLIKLISLIKNTLIDYTNNNDIQLLANYYDIEYEDYYQKYIEYILNQSIIIFNNKSIIDFDDMIWLPIILSISLKHKYDWIFIDESQDLNKCQINLIMNMFNPSGRVIAVGDPKQSIYGFRGADSNAMDNIQHILNAKILNLSITYRCPKLHVEYIKSLVPQIECSDDAIHGELVNINENIFMTTIIKEHNPLILGRTNSVIIKFALLLLANGYKAVIKGKDFGMELINIVKKLNATNINEFNSKLLNWKNKEIDKIKDTHHHKIEIINDKFNTMMQISSTCDSVNDISNILINLFSDNNENCFLFSTVHKAKGLENNNVYIINPNLFPLIWKDQMDWEYQQELNVKYVAYTRSKNKIVNVLLNK